jgi:hypothetical protein
MLVLLLVVVFNTSKLTHKKLTSLNYLFQTFEKEEGEREKGWGPPN